MSGNSWAREKLKGFSKKCPGLLRLYRRSREDVKKKQFAALQRENPVDEKLVVFESFWGKSYSCSPKAIYEGMLRDKRYDDYHFIWSFQDIQAHRRLLENPRTRLVQRNSKEYEKAFAKAKIWIYNMSVPEYMEPSKDQIYVETWHGTPLKRVGCDIIYESDCRRSRQETIAAFEKKGAKVDYLLSPSVFYDEVITSAFGLKKSGNEAAVVHTGYPRNDYLYHYSLDDLRQIKERLGIPENKKTLLYTPTWRENQYQSQGGFASHMEIDLNELFRILGNDYVLLYRAHHHISTYDWKQEWEGRVIDVTGVEDVNELYIISDLLITDYSSTMFDYGNLGRPMVFYMYDLEEYGEKLRGFYFDVEELPGPIVKTTQELAQAILKLRETFVYDEKYQRFQKKFNTYEDGGATQRTLDLLLRGKDGNQ